MQELKQELIVRREFDKGDVELSREARDLCQSALDESALILVVDSPSRQQVAVAAQATLHETAAAIEKARKTVKEPYLEICRRIDAVAKHATEPLSREKLRVATLVANWQGELAERERVLARERQAQLDAIEAQRQAAQLAVDERLMKEAASAKGEAERAAALQRAEADRRRLEELAQQEAQAATQVPAAPKAEGQIVRREWTFTVTNDWALAKARPDWVRRFEWDAFAIKDYLAQCGQMIVDGKVTIPGLSVKLETKSSVRKTQQTTVDVGASQ